MYTLTLSQARDFIANELEIVDLPTEEDVHRWCTVGVNGVFLPHIRIGEKVFFSPNGVHEFLKHSQIAL